MKYYRNLVLDLHLQRYQQPIVEKKNLPMSISLSFVLPGICLNQLSFLDFPTPGPSVLDF
jgi:hypothetical protein